MRSFLKFIVLTLLLFFIACGGEKQESTPVDTFKAYALAFKKKDLTTMKLLLSDASLKMAEQQAQAQGATVDDIVKNETLFNPEQKDFFFRNEKIEGDRATLEVKNSFNSWVTIVLVREGGVWKIDKQGMANQIQQQNEIDNQKLNDLINNSNPQDGTFNPSVPQDSTVNPNNPTLSPMTPNNSPESKVNPNVAPSIITNQNTQP